MVAARVHVVVKHDIDAKEIIACPWPTICKWLLRLPRYHDFDYCILDTYSTQFKSRRCIAQRAKHAAQLLRAFVSAKVDRSRRTPKYSSCILALPLQVLQKRAQRPRQSRSFMVTTSVIPDRRFISNRLTEPSNEKRQRKSFMQCSRIVTQHHGRGQL